MKIDNAKGIVWYGLHFYPGVAEYQDPNGAYRVFLNEDTLRAMDPTFAGRPVFVAHVDEIDEDIDELRKEADGWVIESFYNAADGKHWVKFITVTDRADRAIRNRQMQLSNSYIPNKFADGGLWNGVAYQKEITGAEYEHLAIVPDPRYEESVIMTPEEFKKYNSDKEIELKRLQNSKETKGDSKMKLNFFKKAKVDNSVDLASMSVVLPKSGKEVTIEKLVAYADARLERKKNSMAEPHDKVKMHDGNMCNVSELVEKHKALHDELEGMKAKKDDAMEPESELEEEKEPVEVEGDDKAKDNEEDCMSNDDPSELDDEGAIEKDKKNDEDEDAKKKALQLAEHEEKEIEAAKKKKNDLEDKKASDKVKADRLKNAHLKNIGDNEPTMKVELIGDQIERGKARYGSK